jgi:hypothetical protein
MAQSEDRPIIVGGGAQMITIELPRSFKSSTKKGKFAVAPKDAKAPFKSIIVSKGKAVISLPLDGGWSIRIE